MTAQNSADLAVNAESVFMPSSFSCWHQGIE
jgi:hypothetical protein